MVTVLGRADGARLLLKIGTVTGGASMILQLVDPDFWKQQFENAEFNRKLNMTARIRRPLVGSRFEFPLGGYRPY